MGLFQKSIEKKYLKNLNSILIDKKYAEFQNYFGNPERQENIRNSKEEQFQEGFLRELFVKILGYTLNPEPNFNLTTELKNIANSKKADGAILAPEHAPVHAPLHAPLCCAIIELKGTDTTDLDKIETQAFGYKNHHPKCKYVITSNFEKLRFYIQNAVDHIDFDLVKLSKEQFALLWLCLAKDNLLGDLPLKIKESSVLQEENITKKLYADYSKFREAIYNNLVKNNPETDTGTEQGRSKLLLFKKTQKLLDRFIFIFFAEDRLLLPPNSISEIVKQWTTLKDELDEYFPLYSRFKKYFGYLNTGFKGKKYDIYAYNGGLFKPDDILDNITIDDDILHEHTLCLSNYDFETDVDVNILGHIFEHSLGEIAAIAATGEHAPLYAERRKKDGIFYTPKYITKYIVENTVGKLCEEKRTELEIVDEEYAKGRKNRKKELVKNLDKKLDEYRNWLLSLTILDPACGSGAFLNQALEFLINEHRKIDELHGQLLGGAIIFSDITNDILEKNIYGVDLNEESVEIAKLSLWLRTAQKGRKLNTLSNNIKCGNSLIDDPEVAGEKAFNWQTEFPDIFRKKKKKAWHITTATHNSRYSKRMFDNHVKLGEPVWLSEKEEIIVTETIAEIAKNDRLNIVEYNICGDHAHILLVCDEEELNKIVQKLKSISARTCNIAMGRTIPMAASGEHAPHAGKTDSWGTPEHAPAQSPGTMHGKGEHAPHAGETDTGTTPEHAPVYCARTTDGKGEHAPHRGKTQFHLWAANADKKEVTSKEQLENTINYIRNNRVKHKLPKSKEIEKIKKEFLCTRQHAFRSEYTGGFDVVIGNPPYVQLQALGEMSDTLSKCGYETYNKSADLYCLFYERGCQILKPKGYLSYISSNKWLRVNYGKSLRKFLSTKVNPKILIDFPGIPVFADAVVDPHILILRNEPYIGKTESCVIKTYTSNLEIVFESTKTVNKFSDASWVIIPIEDARKLELMKLKGTKLKDLPIAINYGLKTGFNDAFFIDEQTRQKLIAADSRSAELIKPMVRGRDISPYEKTGGEFLINVHNGIKDKNPPLHPTIIGDYPAIKQHLDAFYQKLEKRGDKGKTPYNLRNCSYLEEFAKPKILYPNMTSVFPFMYDESGLLSNDKSFILTANDNSVSLLFLTAVLNSSLAKLWIWYNCPELGNNRREIRKVYFEHFPVPQANNDQTSILSKYAMERTQLTSNLQSLSLKFQCSLHRKFELENLPKKLQDWYLLSYTNFIKELRKKKIKLTLSQEAEWEGYFIQEADKAQNIKSQIEKTDKEIDRMVYELYGLSEEEIKIVENS